MDNKEIIQDEKQEAVEPKLEIVPKDKPAPEFFEFGDVYFECNRCGNYQELSKGVKDGMQFVLPTSDQHEWRLVCGKCENMMRIFFKKSSEETVEEARKQIALQEEADRKKAEDEALVKALKEQENESKKKGKGKRSATGSTEDTPGTDPAHGEGDAVTITIDQVGSEVDPDV